MRSEAVIRRPRAGDVEQLAALMRPADVAELLALGVSPRQALRDSLAASTLAWAVELDGELAALGGVTEGERTSFLGPADFYVVWLLTGDAVNHHPGAFWRASRRVIRALLERFPVLGNMVDARYSAALRWAARLGAEVCPAVPWGASGLLFHPVVWRA